jgi:hypothetical protein
MDINRVPSTRCLFPCRCWLLHRKMHTPRAQPPCTCTHMQQDANASQEYPCRKSCRKPPLLSIKTWEEMWSV